MKKLMLTDAGGCKGAGGDDVGPGLQIVTVNSCYNLRLSKHQHIVVVAQVVRVLLCVCKGRAAVVLLRQAMLLHHGTHGAIQNQYAFAQQVSELLSAGHCTLL